MNRPCIGAVLSLALFASSAAAETPPRTWQQSFVVTGRPAVQVTTNDGRVHIRTGPAGAVSASVRYQAHQWGWTSPPRAPEVDFHQTGSTITVSAKEPNVFMLFGGVTERLEIDVVIPSESDLTVRCGDGSITIEQTVRGTVTLHTGDGPIRVAGAAGDISLSTGDGSIVADSLDGALTARTGDGRITVSGRFDRLQVHTSDGRVDANVARGSKLEEEWRVESADGALTLRIPRDLAAELRAHTADGRIHFDLPVQVSGRLDPHSVHGLLNGGGPPLVVRTADGSLTLAVSD
jgi:hypothetical protein